MKQHHKIDVKQSITEKYHNFTNNFNIKHYMFIDVITIYFIITFIVCHKIYQLIYKSITFFFLSIGRSLSLERKQKKNRKEIIIFYYQSG
jgi:hypothetical protein